MQIEYHHRREQLASKLPASSIVVLPSAELKFRNADAEYPFRQDSNFYYLTGFTEPESTMVLTKDKNSVVKFIMFNRQKDETAEIWSGRRAGQQGAIDNFGADEAYPIEALASSLSGLCKDKKYFYCPKDYDMQCLDSADTDVNKIDILPLIYEMRLIKSNTEIELLRKSAEISAQAHNKLLQACKPGLKEYQLEAIFSEYCMYHGCRALAYTPIVAAGNNACTLHYIENNSEIKANDLVLVDAGGEYNFYAADITRTFPANGKFSTEQRAIYQLVLDAQIVGINQVMPGNTWNMVQDVMLDIIVSGLVSLGIMQGDVKQLIANKEYREFYMHSSGHWLGLDVHDAGAYKVDDSWREFQPGMVLTVEPGIYIAESCDKVESKWRGIGVRIEDDILVTQNSCEVLSKDAYKEVSEIERETL